MALSKKKEQEYIEKVKRDGRYLNRIKKNQTEAICLVAVKQDGWVLKFVKKPTEEILLEAIRNYKVPFGSVLEGIVNPTENLYWIAVKEDGLELEYVKNQTLKICLEAVKRCGWALEYVENQIGEVCLVALLQDSRSYKYIESPTKEMQYLHSTIQKKWKNGLPSYRVIRSKLTVGEIDLTDSPYHVLEQLCSH